MTAPDLPDRIYVGAHHEHAGQDAVGLYARLGNYSDPGDPLIALVFTAADGSHPLATDLAATYNAHHGDRVKVSYLFDCCGETVTRPIDQVVPDSDAVATAVARTVARIRVDHLRRHAGPTPVTPDPADPATT